MKKIIILLITIFTICNANARHEYYNLLRKAEQKIIDNQLDSSLYYYNIAFEKYDYPFIKDMFAATCGAHYGKNDSIFYDLIERLLCKGMSKYELDYFVQKRQNDTIISKYQRDYKFYNDKYLASIDYIYNKKMRLLDRDNQVNINHIKQSRRKKQNASYLDISDSALVKKYTNLVNQFGYPTEKRVGLGSTIAIVWARPENIERGELSKWKRNNTSFFEPIYGYDIKFINTDSVYLFYSHINNTFITRLSTRRGNSFLWHIDIKKYPSLDTLLLKGIDTYKVDPCFYAACLERHGVDYGLSWESKVNSKYKFDLKKIIEKTDTKKVNSLREEINIRPLEKDLELFVAISVLEELKYKQYFNRKIKGKSLFVWALFTGFIP